MAILPTKSITQQISALSPTQSCEEKATMKMATMRFSSAQGASDYRKQLIDECMATASSPTATGTVTNTVSTNLASPKSYVYQADRYTCQTNVNEGGIGFSSKVLINNKELLTVGKFYNYVSFGRNQKVKILNYVGSSQNNYTSEIQDKDKKDRVEDVLCQGFPTATGTVTNTISTNLAPAPVKPGVSAIVQPDFSTVKVYDLDAPSGSPSGSPSGTPSGSSNSDDSVASEVLTEVANQINSVPTIKKPNYLLYLGLVISGVIVYKTFLKKE
jgi:hypothetical protein